MSLPSVVWIVDDDPDDQYLVEGAFKRVLPQAVIKQLMDGDELLPCLRQAAHLPKLILLDLNMARQNGFDTLAELRQIPAYKHLKVVVLTTSANEDDKRKSLALGADGFLTKPPSQQALIHLFTQLVGDWNAN